MTRSDYYTSALASGVDPYFVGKPNPPMMRHALRRIECRREETVIIGDRMDTDIVPGFESENATILVLTGVTSPETLGTFASSPRYVVDGIGRLPELAPAAG